MKLHWLLILGWILSGPIGSSAAPYFIDGTAATVGKTLVTLEDVRFFRAVQKYLAEDKPGAAGETPEELRKALRKLIFEEMLLEEMTSLRVVPSGAAEAERRFRNRRAKDRGGVWKDIARRYRKTEAQFVERIRREIDASHFLERKVQTLSPRITPAEVDRHLHLNSAKFGKYPPARARNEALSELKRKRTEEGLEEWIRFLRDKYGVANYFEG